MYDSSTCLTDTNVAILYALKFVILENFTRPGSLLFSLSELNILTKLKQISKDAQIRQYVQN